MTDAAPCRCDRTGTGCGQAGPDPRRPRDHADVRRPARGQRRPPRGASATRSPRSSGPTARARRRCSTCSPGSTSPTAALGGSTTTSSRARRPTRSPGSEWCAPSSSRRRSSRLTVLDNMLLGAPNQRGERFLPGLFQTWRAQERENTERALDLLERFNLVAKRDDPPARCRAASASCLEMARALMVDPQLVMLDEPMAGVNPALVESLLDHVRELARRGSHGRVRRARHGRGDVDQRLGRVHGRRQRDRRGSAGLDRHQRSGHRRVPRNPPRPTRPVPPPEETA